MRHYLEQDLYRCVKTLFEELDFSVKAEVLNCDVLAVRNDLYIAVELKLKLNLEVILQAVDRQKTVESVYIAVPVWGLPKQKSRYKAICHLLKRLEVGLILIDEQGDGLLAFIESDAVHFDRGKSMQRNAGYQFHLKKEFKMRYGDDNIGGSTRVKRMTAYRQDALAFAILIDAGYSTLKELKSIAPALDSKTTILQHNHYGWFNRVKRGVYELSASGVQIISTIEYEKREGLLSRVKVSL